MKTYQNPKYCVAHVKQRWLKGKKTRQNGYLVKSAQIGCNRVNRFNPFGPHIINRGAKGFNFILNALKKAALQKFLQNISKIKYISTCFLGKESKKYSFYGIFFLLKYFFLQKQGMILLSSKKDFFNFFLPCNSIFISEIPLGILKKGFPRLMQ
ncbi:hypothetical protein BpHYR1_007332 [Brachionus plicatilis]|uniref:Uncharacterized protein n=1 Tax=Brachionus plicatilis TaxID=10195 RepID=A0A3M7RZ00_BRAPC|nr:hypothetical protein BpHYR1_007332 [Brachionus plicatilis]